MWEAWPNVLFVDPEYSAWEFKDKSTKKLMDDILGVANSTLDQNLLLDSKGVVWKHSKSSPLVRIRNLPKIKAVFGTELGSMVFLDTAGFVWCWGANIHFNLGIPNNSSPKKPIKNKFLSNISSVAISKHHSLFLTEEGRVWGCGYNCEGQLGLGEKRSGIQREPALIENLPVIDKIAAGYHSMFLDLEGNVWVCGWNNYGELGLKHTQTVYEPTRVADLPAIVDISAGYLHSLFLDVDGKVWSCGYNLSGQLGRSERPDSPETIADIPPITEIEGTYRSSYLIDQDGRLWVCGEPNIQPVNFRAKLVEDFSSRIMPKMQRKQGKSARNVASTF